MGHLHTPSTHKPPFWQVTPEQELSGPGGDGPGDGLLPGLLPLPLPSNVVSMTVISTPDVGLVV